MIFLYASPPLSIQFRCVTANLNETLPVATAEPRADVDDELDMSTLRNHECLPGSKPGSLRSSLLPFVVSLTGDVGGKVQSAGGRGAGNVTFVQIFDGGYVLYL